MKLLTKHIGIALVCWVGMVLVGAILYPSLPDQMPIHFNIEGVPDNYAPKIVAVSIAPLLAIVLWVAMSIIPDLDPRRESYDKFEGSYLHLRTAILLFVTGLHVVTLTQHENPVLIVRLLIAGMGLLFAFLGNEMGRFRQTWFTGIRTPWTLMDERVWRKTHRVSARWFVLFGVVLLLTAFILPLSWLAIFVLAGALGITGGMYLYSYRVFHQLNH